MSEKVNEFLREISPMREAKFWHDFIAHFLKPTRRNSDVSVNDFLKKNNNNLHSDTVASIYPKQITTSQPPLPLKKPSSNVLMTKPALPYKPPYLTSAFKSVNFVPAQQPQQLTSSEIVSSQYRQSRRMQIIEQQESVSQNGTSAWSYDYKNIPVTAELPPIASSPPTQTISSSSITTTTHTNNDQLPPSSPKVSRSKSSSCNSVSSHQSPPLKRSNSVPENGNEDLIPPKPMFSSSTFYDPQKHPTIEDQVVLCREIAKQLVSDESNAKSKGREMFERRVQKSSRWVTENEDSFQNFTSTEEDFHERTISEGPPNLRLLLDPRHVDDINTVQGVNEHIIAAQEEQTRDTCKHIVQDLTSPEVHPNRGNTLFAKRVEKSEEWIIDDVAEQVIDAARDKLFRNVKGNSLSSSPLPFSVSPASNSHYSASPIPISGPVFTSVSTESRPSSSQGVMYNQFKDFNNKAKPFCRAY